MSEVRNVVIIGSGPAGYTAAIYTARANLEPLLFQGMQPGGQLTVTTDVENFPGYPEGVMGPQMMEEFRAQAEKFGTEIRFEQINEVDFSSRALGHRLHRRERAAVGSRCGDRLDGSRRVGLCDL